MAVDSQQPGMPTQPVARPRRRFQFTIKALLLFTAYVAVLLSILMTLVTKRSYRATAWIRFEAPGHALIPPAPDLLRRRFETEVRRPMLSSDVLTAAAGRPEIAKLSVFLRRQSRADWLAEHVEVEQVGASQLAVVALAARDPEDATKIVNAVVDSYFEWYDERSPEAARFRRQLQSLEQERERRAAELRRLAEDVDKLAQRASAGADSDRSPPQRPAAEPPLGDVTDRLAQAESDRAFLEAELAALTADLEVHEQADAQTDAAPAARERVEVIEAQLDVFRAGEAALHRRLRKRIEDCAGGGNDLVERELATAKLACAQRVYEIVSDRLLLLKTQGPAQQRVQLLRKAVVPRAAVKSISYKTILLFIVLYLVPLPFIAARFWRTTGPRGAKS